MAEQKARHKVAFESRKEVWHALFIWERKRAICLYTDCCNLKLSCGDIDSTKKASSLVPVLSQLFEKFIVDVKKYDQDLLSCIANEA